MRTRVASLALLAASLVAVGCSDDYYPDQPDEDDCHPDERWVGERLTARVAPGGDQHLVYWTPSDTGDVHAAIARSDGTTGESQLLPSGRSSARPLHTGSGFRLVAMSSSSAPGILTVGLDDTGQIEGDWQRAASWDEGQDFNQQLAVTFDGDQIWVAASSHPGGLTRPDTVRIVRLGPGGQPLDPQARVVHELFDPEGLEELAVARVGDVVWIVWGKQYRDDDDDRRYAVEGARVGLDGSVLEAPIPLLEDARDPVVATSGDRLLIAATAGGPLGNESLITRLVDENGPLAPQSAVDIEGRALQLVAAENPPGFLALMRLAGATTGYPCNACDVELHPLSVDDGLPTGPPLFDLDAVDAILSRGASGYLLATITEEGTRPLGATRLHLRTMGADGILGDATELDQSTAHYEQIVCD